MHVFLSPHLDDVILSCGATMAQLKQRGEQVLILTVMAGEPPETLPDTPAIRALQERFQGVHKAVLTTRAEELQAAMCLGVKIYHLSILECCYRTAQSVSGPLPLYDSEESQYGTVHPADDTRVSLLATPLPFKNVSCIYAPLAAGNHVDHQLVRDWALVLGGSAGAPRLKFYGEYPYMLHHEALERALQHFARALPAVKLIAELVALDDADVRMKLMAVGCYASQFPVLWETREAMERIVRAWMHATGNGIPAERYWHIVRQTGALGASQG